MSLINESLHSRHNSSSQDNILGNKNFRPDKDLQILAYPEEEDQAKQIELAQIVPSNDKSHK